MRQGQQNRRNRGRNSRKTPQNSLSRNYESNGPDVKIRGTASHVAEKYMSLARDALSAGDTVAAENLLQHAEHYNRIVMSLQNQGENLAANQQQVAEAANSNAASASEGQQKSKGSNGVDTKKSDAPKSDMSQPDISKSDAPKSDTPKQGRSRGANGRRRSRKRGNGHAQMNGNHGNWPQDAQKENGAEKSQDKTKEAQPSKSKPKQTKKSEKSDAQATLPTDSGVSSSPPPSGIVA